MSDLHETVRALEARIAELERNQAFLQEGPMVKAGVTRRRAAVFALTVALLVVPGVALASHQFTDVPNSNPFHDDIDWLADYRITTGFGDGTFRPGNPVTRQAMAAFMHRLSNEFGVRSTSSDPGAATVFSHSTSCQGDRRPIAGGGDIGGGNLFITRSYPAGSSWVVHWETDDNATVDPSFVQVWALCAPRR